MSHNKENTHMNPTKRNLGKISYRPFQMLDTTVDFTVEDDIKLLTKRYDDIDRTRRGRARDLMGVEVYDELSRHNSALLRSSRNRFDCQISQQIEEKIKQARLKSEKDMDERENHQKRLAERHQKQRELNKVWLSSNPEIPDDLITSDGFVLVDKPIDEVGTTPKPNTSLLRRTKSFFNFGGKKSSKKNTHQNRFTKQSKRY